MASIMEGPLSKWTNVMKGWQYRWFVLDYNAGLLSYYTRELALAPIWPLRPGDGPVRVSPSRAARLRNVCAEERSPAASYPGAAAALSPHMLRSLPRPHIASRFETDFPASAEDFLLSSTNF